MDDTDVTDHCMCECLRSVDVREEVERKKKVILENLQVNFLHVNDRG